MTEYEIDHDQPLRLNQILSTLRNHWRLFLGPVLLSFVLFVLYVALWPKTYVASSQVLINLEKPQVIGSDAQGGNIDVTRFLIGPVMDSQVEIIRSTRIAAEVIEDLNLIEEGDYLAQGFGISYITSLIKSFFEPSDSSEEAGNFYETSSGNKIPLAAIRKFQENLDVRRKGLTLILQISVADDDSSRAARISNAVASRFLAVQLSDRQTVSVDLTRQLAQRVDELREQLLARQAFLQDYIAENQLVTIGGLAVDEREIASMINVIVESKAQLAQQEAELRQVSRLDGLNQDTGQVAGSASSQNPTPLNSQFVGNMQYEYEIVSKKIQLLEDDLSRLSREFSEKNKLAIRRDELQREVDATKDLYSALLLRLKESLVQGSILYPDGRVIDPASIPVRPAGPGKLILLLLFSSIGIFSGLTFVLIRYHLAWSSDNSGMYPTSKGRNAA